MNFKIRFIERSEFETLAAEWSALLSRTANPVIFMTWEWAAAWLHSYGASKRWVLAGAWHNDQLVGLLPLYYATGGQLQLWGVSDLEPDGIDLIIQREGEMEILMALLEFLRRMLPGWHELRFEAINAQSSLLSLASSLSISSHFIVTVQQTQTCPAVLLRGTFREYLDSIMKPKHRQEIERRVRQVSQRHGLAFLRVDSAAQLPQALDDLFRLHSHRKADQGKDTRFQGIQVEQFHRELAPMLLAQGKLALYGLYLCDHPVCMLYCFEHERRLFAYQSGLDPGWIKASLGSCILQMVLKDCLERGLTRMDLSRGENKYKTLIANETTHNSRVRLYKRTAGGTLRWLMHRLASKAGRRASAVKRRLKAPAERRTRSAILQTDSKTTPE